MKTASQRMVIWCVLGVGIVSGWMTFHLIGKKGLELMKNRPKLELAPADQGSTSPSSEVSENPIEHSEEALPPDRQQTPSPESSPANSPNRQPMPSPNEAEFTKTQETDEDQSVFSNVASATDQTEPAPPKPISNPEDEPRQDARLLFQRQLKALKSLNENERSP